jgi:hypothetical protein
MEFGNELMISRRFPDFGFPGFLDFRVGLLEGKRITDCERFIEEWKTHARPMASALK